jgi:acetylglutamate kinase
VKPIMVIKLGGSALDQLDSMLHFVEECQDYRVVLIHGGGPQISEMLQSVGHEPVFHHGLRITDSETLDIVTMVLGGLVNKQLVTACQARGYQAAGLCGIDGGTLRAELKLNGDLGHVGDTPAVDPKLLLSLLNNGFTPVLAPLGLGPQGQILNINADTTAGAVAAALKAQRFVFLTDVAGVLDEHKRVLRELDADGVEKLKAVGAISIGMIPKLEAALHAAERGVLSVEIRSPILGPGTQVKSTLKGSI